VTENGFPRSRFLRRAALAVGGLAGLGAGLRALGGALPPASAAGSARPIDLGPLDAFPEGQFVLATFLSDPASGEVSRRAAYIRNNALVDGRPSFTIMSSRCTHVGCPTQPNGPLLSRQQKVERGATGEVGLVRRCPAVSAAHATAASSTPRATARPAPRRARSTGTSSRSATAASGLGRSTASAASRARAQPRRSGGSAASAPASPPLGRNRSCIRSTRCPELRARASASLRTPPGSGGHA
jgi:Rieske Fe-S protein